MFTLNEIKSDEEIDEVRRSKNSTNRKSTIDIGGNKGYIHFFYEDTENFTVFQHTIKKYLNTRNDYASS